ncbi:uncharacterized protein TNCV_4751431 [Trichonephila clavipes]|nr:uncharacterized protein TNCV_4751431 [Trichonephila clavipes]
MKPWFLHARLELYKGMVAESWSGVFFVELFGIIGACTKLPQYNSVRRVPGSNTGWLDDHSSDFSIINWPPRSPDLNPIVHLWDVLEQGVKCHPTAPTNLTELWTALANIWQVERFQKLVESMLHSVETVIKARGGAAR